MIKYDHNVLAEGVSQMQRVTQTIKDESDALMKAAQNSVENWETEASAIEYRNLSAKLNQQIDAASAILGSTAGGVQQSSDHIKQQDRQYAKRFAV